MESLLCTSAIAGMQCSLCRLPILLPTQRIRKKNDPPADNPFMFHYRSQLLQGAICGFWSERK